jgi:hypothetical protein
MEVVYHIAERRAGYANWQIDYQGFSQFLFGVLVVGSFYKPDDQQRPSDEQAESGGDVRELYYQLLPRQRAGGAGLLGGDGQHLICAPPGIGRLREQHGPGQPDRNQHHADRLRSHAIWNRLQQHGQHDEQQPVAGELNMRDQGQPGIRCHRHDEAPGESNQNHHQAVQQNPSTSVSRCHVGKSSQKQVRAAPEAIVLSESEFGSAELGWLIGRNTGDFNHRACRLHLK